MTYDVLIIGAGPSGLMAAGKILQHSKPQKRRTPRVAVLESNQSAGKKLLLTGGRRCNLTNLQYDMRELSTRYGREGKALISPFTAFTPSDCISLFHSLGVKTKVEAEQRVFPVSDEALQIRDALLAYSEGADMYYSSPASDISYDAGEQLFTVKGGRKTFQANLVILATGGFARPDTGSDGSGFELAAALGHSINRPDAMLVPVAVHEKRVSTLMGVSVQDCGIGLYLKRKGPGAEADMKKLDYRRGKVLFTHFGLSGPGILNFSGRIGELERSHKKEISNGARIIIELNIHPDTDVVSMEKTLLDLCNSQGKKLLKNALQSVYPGKFLKLLDPELQAILDQRCADLNRENRKLLAARLSGLQLTFKRRMPPEDAIVSRGGISINEVDFRSMESKRCKGLYILGDMLDINRPSGGYSLQLCWSSAWVAGESVSSRMHELEDNDVV